MIAVEVEPGLFVFMTVLDYLMSSLYPCGCAAN